MQQLYDQAPSLFRKTFPAIVEDMNKELKANEAALEDREEGAKEQHLFKVVRHLMKGDPAEKREIIEAALTGAECRSLYPGVIMLLVEDAPYHAIMTKMGYPDNNIGGMAFCSSEPNEVSFFLVEKKQDKLGLNRNSYVRHEACHVLETLLARAGMSVPAAETTEELSTAFDHFRREFMAHNFVYRDLFGLHPTELIYTTDPEITSIALRCRNFTSLCVKIAKQYNIASADFMYAATQSATFEELMTNCVNLIPRSRLTVPDLISVLYANRISTGADEAAHEVVAALGATIGDGDLTRYLSEQMRMYPADSLSAMNTQVQNFAGFALSFFGRTIDDKEIVRTAVQEDISGLGPLTIDLFMQLAPVLGDVIPVGIMDIRAFTHKLIENALWHSDKEDVQQALVVLFTRCPELRQILRRDGTAIFEDHATGYIQEMGESASSRADLDGARRAMTAWQNGETGPFGAAIIECAV